MPQPDHVIHESRLELALVVRDLEPDGSGN
jgi:hypothetical protein